MRKYVLILLLKASLINGAFACSNAAPLPVKKGKYWLHEFVVHKQSKNEKLTAILFALALGPLGVHRLYLGTEAHVPVIYTATLGGGFGLLPIADIVAILAAKDIERYKNNPRVIMWAAPTDAP